MTRKTSYHGMSYATQTGPLQNFMFNGWVNLFVPCWIDELLTAHIDDLMQHELARFLK